MVNPMKQVIENVLQEIRSHIGTLDTKEKLESFRNTFLARKGKIAGMFDEIKSLPKEEKPEAGKLLNALRKEAESILADATEAFESSTASGKERIDVTLPGRTVKIGHQHIITKTVEDIKTIFKGMGFGVALGPEIETDYYNFGSLNFADDHPRARYAGHVLYR